MSKPLLCIPLSTSAANNALSMKLSGSPPTIRPSCSHPAAISTAWRRLSLCSSSDSEELLGSFMRSRRRFSFAFRLSMVHLILVSSMAVGRGANSALQLLQKVGCSFIINTIIRCHLKSYGLINFRFQNLLTLYCSCFIFKKIGSREL